MQFPSPLRWRHRCPWHRDPFRIAAAVVFLALSLAIPMGIQEVTSAGTRAGCYESLLLFASHCSSSSWSCTAKEVSNGEAEWCGGNYVLLTQVSGVSPLVQLRVSEPVFFFNIVHRTPIPTKLSRTPGLLSQVGRFKTPIQDSSDILRLSGLRPYCTVYGRIYTRTVPSTILV